MVLYAAFKSKIITKKHKMKNWCKIIETEKRDILVQIILEPFGAYSHSIEISSFFGTGTVKETLSYTCLEDAQGDFANINGVSEIEELTDWTISN